MKYLVYATLTEKYYFSSSLPTGANDCDIIDLEAKKCISGPSGEHDLEEYSEPDEEAETQEIPAKEEREFDPERKFDVESAPDIRIED